jgi:hypothetical protein
MLKLVFATLVVVMTAGSGWAATNDRLDSHRWKSRVLVVLAGDGHDEALEKQRQLFRAMTAGATDRDLVLVEGIGDTAAAQTLRRRFGIADGAFHAILVGKDGGEKLQSAAPLGPEELFPLIDSMPMRQDEMRRKGT